LNDSLSITLRPIAYVKNAFQDNTPSEEIGRQPSQVIVEPEFEPGLMGLEPGMDILVLFYLHRIKPEEIDLQLHPRHDPEKPLTGVFNTRSQFRPNRIGASVVRIEQIEALVMTVSGLDAQDGTPVLDIKAHAPYFDADRRSQQFEVRPVATLQEARDQIDLIDSEIIRLLGNRAGYVRQVVNFKKRPEDVPAPARYAEVMRERRKWAEAARLNPDVIESMYKLLVNNFIEEELELMRRREAQNY
jgi:tRNA-Thr(GGU) m(6)t(6)A37 methyltransferase TsaA